ncbi:MAG: ABC transporter permease [Clostridia bacterium]|nr:ABC transporter permease [Clostridia bacterium]
MTAVFKREMKAYFTMPVGYIVIAVMLLLSGMYFSYMCKSSYSNISFVFSSISSIALLMAPIITMRLFSEDRKQKVDQALFTAPVKLISIVFGKFLAAFTLFMIPMGITLIYQIVLAFTADINWLLYLSDILGIALMGAAILSIGLFISALTESQMIAGIFGMAVSFFIMQIDYFASAVNVEWFSSFCTSVSFISRYNAFTSGQFDFSNIVFFISVVVIFLYFTHLVLDKKRWA